MAGWKDKLGKRELKHLREHGITTLKAARRNSEHQAKMRHEHPDIEPCFQCKTISMKLGLPIRVDE